VGLIKGLIIFPVATFLDAIKEVAPCLLYSYSHLSILPGLTGKTGCKCSNAVIPVFSSVQIT